MLLPLQEQTCLNFFSLSVAVSENVRATSAKCLKLTGINRIYVGLFFFLYLY